MRAFVSPERMRELDALTLSELKINSFALMEKVSQSMFEVLRSRFLKKESRVLVLTGPGNNAGDAYVLSTLLLASGYEVAVASIYEPKTADCKKAAQYSNAPRLTDLTNISFDSFDFIVDGVFGLSGSSDLDDRLAKLLRSCNQSSAFRIALDVPTGVDCEGEKFHIDSFQADLTLCVAYPKTAFLKPEILKFLGEIEFIDPGFVQENPSSIMAIERADFIKGKRNSLSYKQKRVGIIAGSEKSPGAAFLAAEAAARMGCGYSTLFFAEKPSEIKISLQQASFLYRPTWKPEDLLKEDVLIVGCGGLPKNLASAFNQLKQPQVFDAEVFSHFPLFDPFKSAFRILTPHPGELARVLKISTEEVVRDPYPAARLLSDQAKSHVYLKTLPGVLVFYAQDPNTSYVNLSANQAFATAGSGDVLAGIIGSSLAQHSENLAKAVISALVFQREVGNQLRKKLAAISSDQLEVFSDSLQKLS